MRIRMKSHLLPLASVAAILLAASCRSEPIPSDPSPGIMYTLIQADDTKALEELLREYPMLVHGGADNSWPPLYAAVRMGKIQCAELLIQQGAYVNASGSRPLSEAASKGSIDMMELLWKHGAYLDGQSFYSMQTPLHQASIAGQLEAARWLIAKGAAPNVKDFSGATPLDYALKRSHGELAQFLRKHGGASPWNDDPKNMDLSKAILQGKDALVEQRLPTLSDKNPPDPSTLRAAIQANRPRLVRALIKKGAALEQARGTSLQLAVKLGHTEIVTLLLELGADANSSNDEGWTTPLHQAAAKGYDAIVKTLLAHKADPNAPNRNDKTPVHLAAVYGHKDCLEQLFLAGGDLTAADVDGRQPIHFACRGGHDDVVAFLLNKNVDLRARSDRGETPLGLALAQGSLPSVERLLADGADVNRMVSDEGRLPIHRAPFTADCKWYRLLAKHGAVLNAPDPDDKTLLHRAAGDGMLPAAEYFLDQGLSLLARDSDGNTPLHLAAKNHHFEMVKYLVSKGADINMANRRQLTATGIARHKEIKEFLLTRGKAKKDVQLEFRHAVLNGMTKRAKEMLALGASVQAQNRRGETILKELVNELARRDKALDISMMELLLDNGAKPWVGGDKVTDSRPEYTLVLIAVLRDRMQLAKTLLARGQKVTDATTGERRTALHLVASRYKDNDAVRWAKFLLAKGAQIDARDAWGWTPLHQAVASDNRKLAAFLIAKGAKIEGVSNGRWSTKNVAPAMTPGEIKHFSKLRNKKRGTPLVLAAATWNWDMVRLLLKKKANVNAVSHVPLLILAVRAGEVDIVKAFVDAKLSVNVKDEKGETPLITAVRGEHIELVRYLLEEGADATASTKSGETALTIALSLEADAIAKCLKDKSGNP